MVSFLWLQKDSLGGGARNIVEARVIGTKENVPHLEEVFEGTIDA